MPVSAKVKHCKVCDKPGHTAFYCPKRARKPLATTRTLKQNGKQHKRWQAARRRWFNNHPDEEFTCYICGRRMDRAETTLDHVRSRSRAPELRYDQGNLRPCCWDCNNKKGSKDIEEVRQKGLVLYG